ncbi:MAG TPA: EAL domain-containing protein [Sulfuricurvum sp.]|nr:EAL domain-containing protein [Sulfuricurvum sp.]
MDKIRIKATLLAIVIVLLLIGYFVFNAFKDKKRTVEEETHEHREVVLNAYRLSVLDAEKELNHFAFKMLTDQNVVNAFEAHNRDALYRAALPYLNEAHAQGAVDLAGFIQHDGIHFLRLQDPQKFGDNIAIKRPMIAEALRTRKPMVSLDVTLYNISLVSLVPIFKNNHFLGLLQVSVKIDRIQERLNTYAGIKSALAFDTQALHQLLPDKQLKEYGNYSLISSNDPLFDHLLPNYSFEDSFRSTYNKKTYIIATEELRTYANKPLARMICALDITEDEMAYKRDIRELIVVSLTVLLLLSVVLHIGFKALIDRIRNLSAHHTQQLQHQLYNDFLTGLPNRKALYEDIVKEDYTAVMLLNIDNFKEMNDLYGHEIGDKILLAVGHAIDDIIGDYPLSLYRMHADEYALMLTERVSPDEFDHMCHTILNALRETYYNIEGITVFVTVSMGADICFEYRCDLIGRADMALKTAKKRGLSFVKYHDELHIKEDYLNNILWSKKLKDAIDDQQFLLYYQGVHETATQNIYEYEALIRMVDNEGTVVSPGMFLEIAKKSRLYCHITSFVIDQIFKQLQATPHRYSINLSIDDILDRETQNTIYQLLESSRVGDRLIFEILESEGIENYEEVSTFITHVKQYGCQIAIDDFGTGYSNFAYLMRLNVDFIKIDASLIKNLDIDLSAQDIVRTIVEFAHRLNLRTIAEFVSSEEIYDECKELGIDYVQGYYLSRPEPAVRG